MVKNCCMFCKSNCGQFQRFYQSVFARKVAFPPELVQSQCIAGSEGSCSQGSWPSWRVTPCACGVPHSDAPFQVSLSGPFGREHPPCFCQSLLMKKGGGYLEDTFHVAPLYSVASTFLLPTFSPHHHPPPAPMPGSRALKELLFGVSSTKQDTDQMLPHLC